MAEEEKFDVEQFIYIKIPTAIQPADRAELFEDKIDIALEPRNLGHVSGGGTLLGKPDADGNRSIEFCGIDVDTIDRNEVLIVLRRLLPDLGVPLYTELHYTVAGKKLQDRFIGADWLLEESRDFLHPGFDI